MKKTLLCMLGATIAVAAAAVAVNAVKNMDGSKKRKKIKFTECDCEPLSEDMFDDDEEFIDYTCQCGDCTCSDDEAEEKSDDEKTEETKESESTENSDTAEEKTEDNEKSDEENSDK